MIRPSKLSRLERCPASLKLELAIPVVETTSEYAEKGKRLHEIISKGIKNPEDKIAIIAQCQDNDEVIIVDACLKAAEDVWKGLTDSQRSRARVRIEKTLDLKAIGIDQGTPDLAIIIPPTDTEDGLIHILDWKTGVGWVSPARWNLQIMAYAVGSVKDISNYSAVLSIIQPLKRETPDIWVASKEDLLRCRGRIERVINEANKGDAPISSGQWCEYCPVKPNCPARALVAAEIQAIQDPVKIITALDGSARTALYSKLGEAIKILEKAKEQIDTQILNGELIVDGFEVGPGKVGRFWAKEQYETVEGLLPILKDKGLVDTDLYELMSVSKIEKLLGKDKVPADLVAGKPGNPTIKRSKK